MRWGGLRWTRVVACFPFARDSGRERSFFFSPRAQGLCVSIAIERKISAGDVGRGRLASSRERRAVAGGIRVRATRLRIICDLAY
jgi:hypothetical protein